MGVEARKAYRLSSARQYTMRIFVPKETHPAERRVPMLPSGVAKLVKLGAEIEVEEGLGTALNFLDHDYQKAGATISSDRLRSLAEADALLRALEDARYGRARASIGAAELRSLRARVRRFRPVLAAA